MESTRREFLRMTGTAAVSAVALGLGIDPTPIEIHAQSLKIDFAEETTSICCYCAVGCGLIVHAGAGGEKTILNVEGDPDHPINEGALCSKGAALRQLVDNENRIVTPLYRKPYSAQWQRVSWDWALDTIAARIKRTRDETFQRLNKKSEQVNRTTAIASVGSAALDNEECWLLQSMMRAFGLVYIEHQARI